MTRAERRRLAREDETFDQYIASGFMPKVSRTLHAVCARCGRRDYLTVPLRVCNRRCLREALAFRWAAAQFGVRL